MLLIKKVAITGGDILMKHFNKSYEIHQKGENDVVTSIDVEAERVIIKIIENIFPKHNILSEEKGFIDKKSEYTWIIDPLDGTRNYTKKIPIFGNSIALERKGEVILGVVYLPVSKDLFYAMKGKGAFLNGKPLEKLKATHKKAEDMLITYCHGAKREYVMKAVEYYNKIRPHVMDMRKLGAATLEITHVARGLVDGYIAPGLPVWDFKAAALIVSETGGIVRNAKDGTLLVFAPGAEQVLQAALK